MINKYLINNEKVPDLKKWCEKRNLSLRTFESAIHRAKKKKSNECHPLGFLVIRL